MNTPQIYLLSMVAVASIASAFDWRTGRIPNWLTLGAIAAGLALHAWLSPATSGVNSRLEGLKWSVFGACACALPLLLNWRLGWTAGGDVKLVAAMGALGGVTLGLESVFLALLSAASFIMLRLAWRGDILQAAGNGFSAVASHTILRNRILPPGKAVTSSLRFGPFALAGAAISFALHGGFA